MTIKDYRYLVFAVLIFAGLFSAFAFDQGEDDEVDVLPEEEEFVIPPLVQKELDRKIQKYMKTILDKCRDEAIEEAEFYIDSLVAEEIKLQAGDTLRFPAKPPRPYLGAPIILNDSTEIAPIFDLDTLQAEATISRDSFLQLDTSMLNDTIRLRDSIMLPDSLK